MTNPDSSIESGTLRDRPGPPIDREDSRPPGRHRGDRPGLRETLAAAFRRRDLDADPTSTS